MAISKVDEFLASINDDIEWLETTERDEVECISIQNLTEHLRRLFNE